MAKSGLHFLLDGTNCQGWGIFDLACGALCTMENRAISIYQNPKEGEKLALPISEAPRSPVGLTGEPLLPSSTVLEYKIGCAFLSS